MKFFYKIIILLLFSSNISGTAIRVLLAESENPVWHISAGAGFTFQNPKTGKKLPLLSSHRRLTITIEQGKFIINGKVFKEDQLYLQPINDHAQFEQDHYDGFFMIAKQEGKYYLINVVDVEEYVFAVVKAESWPGWPLEVNKVFAVASRSYVLHQLLKARKKKSLFHIRNTNHHQQYKGVHTCAIIRQAVDETRGLFLGYDGQPILAMFDICCGSIIPSHVTGIVDFEKVPYLARNYACTFCKDCKSFNWSFVYSAEQLQNKLQEGFQAPIRLVKDLKIVKKDKAGVVQKVVLKTGQKDEHFSVHELYKLLPIKSYAFTIKKQGKKYSFSGKGFGHHIGLCQWGAREMVRLGWSYELILKFFYPGTVFMRLHDDIKPVQASIE